MPQRGSETKRSQLSLYVPSDIAGAIEAVRRVVDPVQHSLIPAHVTLCREDELKSFEGWRERLASLAIEQFPLMLRFGKAESFAGHGIMLPCLEGAERFGNLRRAILGRDSIRDACPHLTLAHPRNPKAPGNAIDATCALPSSSEITFRSICLIEQIGESSWKILDRFSPGILAESSGDSRSNRYMKTS